MTTPIYHSTLGPAITQLLALRHSLGYRDKALAARLVVFDRYLAAQGQTDPWLTREVVDASSHQTSADAAVPAGKKRSAPAGSTVASDRSIRSTT